MNAVQQSVPANTSMFPRIVESPLRTRALPRTTIPTPASESAIPAENAAADSFDRRAADDCDESRSRRNNERSVSDSGARDSVDEKKLVKPVAQHSERDERDDVGTRRKFSSAGEYER